MITLQQIAQAAGCSLATVSYALRHDRRIHPATRQRIQELARRLGYRPNPRFAALMAHIRRSRPVATGERIAFVWVHTPKGETTTDPFLQRVFRGAKMRAEALGYQVEQFWAAPGTTDRQLGRVLQARGIVGVLLSPVLHETEATLDFDWENFAPVVIGGARWNPELHQAGHHHYLAMRLTLEKLAAAGCRRPAAIIQGDVNERTRRAWQAAFLVYHPAPDAARELLFMGHQTPAGRVARQLRSVRSDALIVSDESLLEQLPHGATSRLKAPVASLHWSGRHPEIGGIDQCYDLIAANAVDLVATQLASNETGVPPWPRMLLFPGRWVVPGPPDPRPVSHRQRTKKRA